MNPRIALLAALAATVIAGPSEARSYRTAQNAAPTEFCGDRYGGCPEAAQGLARPSGHRKAKNTSQAARNPVSRSAPALVTVSTAAGIDIVVSAEFAGPAQAVIAAAVAEGRRFRRINCFDLRRTHRARSNHKTGDACDSYPSIPARIIRAAGLRSGCDFADCPHFDNARNVGGVAFWNGVKHRSYAHRSSKRLRLAYRRVSAIETSEFSAKGWGYFRAHVHRSGTCSGREVGASVYNEPGKRTASGAMFSARSHRAASSTVDGWSMGSVVTITNPRNGRSVTVLINDVLPHKIRGRPNPSWASGIRLDLTPAAHRALGMKASEWVCAS